MREGKAAHKCSHVTYPHLFVPRRAPTAAVSRGWGDTLSLTPGLSPLGAVIYQHTGGSAPQRPEGERTLPALSVSVCPSVPPGVEPAGAAGGAEPVPHKAATSPVRPAPPAPALLPWLGASARPAESREPPRPAGTAPAVTAWPAPPAPACSTAR